MQRTTDYTVVPENNPRRRKLSGGKKKNVSVVPSHFIQTDVSRVKGETSIFSNLIFYFVNVPTLHSLDSLHKMVVENGGTFSMNLNSSVTHCIASESKGFKFQAAKRQGDVVHYSWLLECCAQKQLLPLQPKYFLFLSEATKKKLEEEVDEFSDSYYLDLNVQELKQLLNNINKIEDSKAKEHCKKKLCPREEWVRFLGCRVYFHLHRQFLKYRNWEVPFELAIRRMKIEICIGGGSIAETLSHATHLVIVSSPEYCLDFDTLLNSFSEAERRLLHRKSLQVVKSQWLDDCFEKKQKLPEDKYNLKPQQFQETSSGESDEQYPAGEEHHTSVSRSRDASSSFGGEREENATSDNPRVVSLPDRVEKRKRGRPTGKQKPLVNLPRKTRPRIGKKPAKISEYESDKGASSDDKEDTKLSSIDCESSKMVDSRTKAGSKQPRRTSARLRNKPVEINENKSDDDAAAEEQTTDENFELGRTNQEPCETSNLPVPNFHMTEAPEDSTSERGKAVEQGVTESSNYGQRFDEVKESVIGQGSSTRFEDDVDPIQAMLLNMVPSLAAKKVESAAPVHDEVKTRAPDRADEEEKLPRDTEMPAVKKRKVSYKEMANELLKDW